MSVNSTNKGLLVPATGDFSGTWGTQVSNNTLVPIDGCFGNQTAITLTSSDHNVTTAESQAPIFNLSGTLTADVNLVFPTLAGGFFIVENACTGAHTVTAKYSGGTGVILPQSARSYIKVDPSETTVKFGAAGDVLTTRGDLLTRDANTYSRLAVGSANQVLLTNGTDPSWGTVAIAGGGTGQTTAAAAAIATAGSLGASFSAVKSGNQTGIASATPTQVAYGTELYDVGSHFASNLWTPPAGTCMLCAGVAMNNVINSVSMVISIYKNSLQFKSANSPIGVGGNSAAFISIMDQCNGTDFYEVVINAASSSTSTALAEQRTFFMGSMI